MKLTWDEIPADVPDSETKPPSLRSKKDLDCADELASRSELELGTLEMLPGFMTAPNLRLTPVCDASIPFPSLRPSEELSGLEAP